MVLGRNIGSLGNFDESILRDQKKKKKPFLA